MRTLLLSLILALAAATQSNAAPVVMIGVDGLRPSELTSPASADWKLPVLRELLHEGVAAQGARPVTPSITFPDLATLVTGVRPAVHGVVGNLRCDLETREDGGYFLYASDVKAETLWQAADRQGLKTANVGWTSTVGAAIDYNLPRVWDAAPGAQYALESRLSTPGLLAQVDPDGARAATPYVMDDARRAAYLTRIVDRYGPDFSTVFFEGFDAAQHASGVDSPQARAALEHIDALIGQVVAAVRAKRPDAVIVVVSDHGFANVSTEINLFRVLADGGLLSLDNGAVTKWQARPCYTGGSAYIVLADPKSLESRARTAAVLERLSADPNNGIERVLDRDGIAARGGWPKADFLVVFRRGYSASASPTGPLRGPSHNRGTHGYWSDDPAMYSTFILDAPDSPLKGNLGVIDIGDVAPTVAKVLGVALPGATGKPLF